MQPISAASASAMARRSTGWRFSVMGFAHPVGRNGANYARVERRSLSLGTMKRAERAIGVRDQNSYFSPILACKLSRRFRSTRMSSNHGPLRVGVGGPVGSGKTALMDALCKRLRERYQIAAITNDIYTKWDAEYLVRSGALPAERIAGVETGGCPHTAIREDASANLAAVADMRAKFPGLDLVLIESGGDNLAATFSPELADLTIYVIDVAAGEKIPSKGGPGITRSDLLVINKMDLAPYVGASLENMERDTKRMRGARPFIFSNLRVGKGVDEIARFIEDKGGLGAA